MAKSQRRGMEALSSYAPWVKDNPIFFSIPALMTLEQTETLKATLRSQFRWPAHIQDPEESFAFNVQPIRDFIREVAKRSEYVSTVFQVGVHTIDGRRGISHVTDGDDLRIGFLD